MNKLKRVLGIVLSLGMILSVVPKEVLFTTVNAEKTETFAFDLSDLGKIPTADKAAVTSAQMKGLAGGYLSTTGSVTLRANKTTLMANAIEWPSKEAGSVDFKVNGTADVTVVLASTGSTNVSPVQLKDSKNNLILPDGETAGTKDTVTGTKGTTFKYSGLKEGNYSFSSYSDDVNNRGARMLAFTAVQTSSGESTRKAWSEVAAPAFGEIKQDGSALKVNYTMVIGNDGADSITCDMLKDGAVVETQASKTEGTTGSVTFHPAASGDYTFALRASRANETDKSAANQTYQGYALPLAKTSFSSTTSMGKGKEEIVWNAVKEATSYEVSCSTDGTVYSTPVEVKDTKYTFEGLTVGTKYSFKVVAKRTVPEAVSEAAVVEATPKDEAETVWSYADFGTNATTDSKYAGYSGNANDGAVSVWNLNAKGKLVPLSTDGVSFYYTAVPSNENFTLSADVNVDSWTLSNGQEGFGLMACDRVGADGNGDAFWNNSYMASVTKVEYTYANGAVTDDPTAPKYTMKLGVGSQQKIGVTKADLNGVATNVPAGFQSSMDTLETSCASKDAGTYNLVGNATNPDKVNTVENPVTTFHLTITRNNTGYFVSYTDAAGKTTTKKYYDTKALDQLDSENVYVGFFASRNAKLTAKNISLKTVDPKNDAPAEKEPVTDVTPVYSFISENTCNSSSYNLQFVANADGNVAIQDESGKTIAQQTVKANEVVSVPTQLKAGNNTFTAVMTPDANYKPGKSMKLSTYDAQTISKTVTYKALSGEYVFVGTNGKNNGDGSRENPVDIYTAVKYAQPGQKIVLLSGTYHLASTVLVPRGTDGTADAKIYMIADSNSSERPVLDFGQHCEGLVAAGNYWYFSGFDVTGSMNGKDGIRLSGAYDTFDNVNAYRNGNTGLQISRYIGTDTFEQWPHDNLILNCTSYSNADAGYEDADGFAAKLTVGNNNVFDGCISHNNADDGWDLFAKPETGSIGSVTIQNCVAYANGYGEDGTDEGNGNGFKLGGSSLSGKHVLKNCVSFDNKSKGIDSNSCPDIQVTNCTSYNNGIANVAFYTNDAKNTDFSADGVISYRTVNTDIEDNIKLKGTQDPDKVFKANNYYWPADQKTVSADWFVNMDTHMDYKKHVYSSLPISRNKDLTINLNGLLVMSEAGIKAVGETDGRYNSGAFLNTVDGKTAGTASQTFTVPASTKRNVTPSTNEETVKKNSTGTPNTGDTTNPAESFAVMMAALAAAILAYRRLHQQA